jgi:hypothetical protein
MKLSKLCAILFTAGTLGIAHGASLFSVVVDISGQVRSAEFSTFEEAIDVLTTSGLRSLNPGYTGVEAATITINLRGLPVIAQYPTAGSTRLVFRVPSLNINETFQGATRDASEEMLEDFLKKNGNDILSRMGKEFAKVSPVDPIAGNPNSLMSQLVMQDFNTGFTDFATNIGGAPPAGTAPAAPVAGAAPGNLIGIGGRFGQYRQDGLTSRSFTLPLSYTFRNDLDPRRQTSFNLPITFVDTEGAKSVNIGLGASYRFPMSDAWALQPAVSISAAGSKDLGSLAAVASVSITSSYVIPMSGFDLAIGNMVGYYTTLKVSSGDYSYDPEIKNTVLRNGVLLSQPVTFGGERLALEYSIVDTHFTGSELYIKHFDEFGISLGTNKSARSARSYMRGGVNYLHSSKSKGVNAYFNYYF